MCIAIISTAHPDYALILINNRDELLNRPTAPADWWDSPNSNVLGGRDLLRAEQGTWLGITREGRLAVLTNFREESETKLEARSRGALVNAFLTQHADSGESTEGFVKSLVDGDGLRGFEGFSLVCGQVGEPLAVVSNRTPDVGGVTWVGGRKGETVGLSNATIDDRSWTKVTEGEKLVEDVVSDHEAAKGCQEDLVESLFRVLSHDTLPRHQEHPSWENQVKELRKSIFIHVIGNEESIPENHQDPEAARTNGPLHVSDTDNEIAHPIRMSGAYGTQKQTIVLVSHNGRVMYVERTMYDTAGNSVDERRVFEFAIDR